MNKKGYQKKYAGCIGFMINQPACFISEECEENNSLCKYVNLRIVE